MDYQGDRWTLGLDAYSYRSTIANGSPLMVGFATVGHMVAAPDASLNQFRGMQAEQQSDGVMLRGTAELNDAWSVYGSLGWAEHEYTGMLNGTRGILQKDGHTLNTQTYNQYGYTKNLTGDVGVRGKFRTGAVAHELVLHEPAAPGRRAWPECQGRRAVGQLCERSVCAQRQVVLPAATAPTSRKRTTSSPAMPWPTR
jgi:iron complex outermembrane receptor protein